MIHDLLIIGGGINGTAIARDAAGRGLDALLVEQDDLASHTSSASTKLIHGGLRYLEYYEFRLVREALKERERLLAAAPHIIWPLRFVLPHDSSVRPVFLVRLGLFLYDHLAKRRRLPGSETLDLATHPAGKPLKPIYDTGFAYSDCWVEDSRLVVLNAVEAAERGATILTRTTLVSARREDGLWRAVLEDRAGGAPTSVMAKAIVNCAGPWVADVIGNTLGLASAAHVRLVKGSHIVVRRLYEGDHAYILQNDDKRIVFAIPYEGAFTLIGTTDIPFSGDRGALRITGEEIEYLCRSIDHCFGRKIGPEDVVWSYSGVRPLFDDGSSSASAVTRDYVFDLNAHEGGAPVLSVFGGKITTARVLAEHALQKLATFFPGMAPAWTAGAPFPGGDMPPLSGDGDAFAPYLKAFETRYPFLPQETARRLVRAYGTRAGRIVGGASSLADLGADFGGGLTAAEIDYLIAAEWARTAEDVLWRRSKLGLHIGARAEDVADYIAQQTAAKASAGAARSEAQP